MTATGAAGQVKGLSGGSTVRAGCNEGHMLASAMGTSVLCLPKICIASSGAAERTGCR